ncbi:WGxxGxxG family protein [Paenibacillus tarimensis]
MKRFSISFLLIAAVMMILAIPAFAQVTGTTARHDMTGVGTTIDRDTTGLGGTALDRTTGIDRTTRGFGYDRVTTDGNFRNYGADNRGAAGRFRPAAAADNDMDWGWLGLVGLLGLAGLRGRNRETT